MALLHICSQRDFRGNDDLSIPNPMKQAAGCLILFFHIRGALFDKSET